MIESDISEYRAMPPLIEQYCNIARSEMLNWMTPNSCIAATRVTCHVMRCFGVKAEPMPTKFLVQVPSLGKAYGSGLSAEERSAATGEERVWPEGWKGHLVAVVAGMWIIDASFDQVDAAMGGLLKLPKCCFPFPLSKEADANDFHMQYDATLDSGDTITIDYVTTEDHSYIDTEAWQDTGLLVPIMRIANQLEQCVRVRAC